MIDFNRLFLILFLSTLGVALLIGFVFLRRKLRTTLIKRLVYERAFDKTGVFEGQTAELQETIYNNSALPLWFVDMEFYIYSELRIAGQPYQPSKSMQLVVSRFHLRPHYMITRKHTVECCKRGFYHLNTADVMIRKEPFFFESPAELYVYPRIVEFEDVPWPMNCLQGESLSNRQLIVDPFSLSGIREYLPGDPFKSINFKATAKSGGNVLKVNKRDFCAARIFMIYINFQDEQETATESPVFEGHMERALSYASAMIGKALENGHKIGFGANCAMADGARSVLFPICSGFYNFEEMLRCMAQIRPAAGISFPAMLEKDIEARLSETEIFIFSTYTNELIERQIFTLRTLGNTVNLFMLE